MGRITGRSYSRAFRDGLQTPRALPYWLAALGLQAPMLRRMQADLLSVLFNAPSPSVTAWFPDSTPTAFALRGTSRNHTLINPARHITKVYTSAMGESSNFLPFVSLVQAKGSLTFASWYSTLTIRFALGL